MATKRGLLPMNILIGILLLIIGFVLILALFSHFVGQAEGIQAEELCHTANALRLGLIPSPVRATVGSPDACQIIDKQDIPSGDYTELSAGAQNQIADMVARCWWMWLEGITKDGKNADVIDWKVGLPDQQCFPCYLFRLSGVALNPGELIKYLETTPYHVTSPRGCSLSGGTCQKECGSTEVTELDYETKATSSKQCPGQNCCIPKNREDECIAKGGICQPKDLQPAGHAPHTWLCPKGQQCYVPAEKFLSYAQYVREGGKSLGFIELGGSAKSGLKPGVQYAILFNEDTSLPKNLGINAPGKLDSILIADYAELTRNGYCQVESGVGKS